jgi:hypothetical protein
MFTSESAQNVAAPCGSGSAKLYFFIYISKLFVLSVFSILSDYAIFTYHFFRNVMLITVY